MIAVVCDMCKKPLESDYEGMMQKGYRFKGSFTYIRTTIYGRKKEVEEGAEQYDICQGCYNRLRNLCKEDD